MAAPELRELQARLFALLTAPAGVRPGLVELGLDARAVEEIIDGDERRSAIDRLDLYANMYFFRIRDALCEDFPKLQALVGEAPFHNLCVDYLWACPSQHPSLRNVGARLPAFLASHPLARAHPVASDLARLEWTRLDVFDAPDAATLTLDDVRALAPEALVALPLAPVPAHACLQLGCAADEVWRSLDAQEPTPATPLAPRAVVVWRQGALVYQRALAPLEADAFALVAGGAAFGALCEWLAARAAPEEAAAQAFTLLGRWIADELIRAPV